VPLYPSKAFAGRSRGGTYGDVVEEMDASIGEILGRLTTLGIERTTLVIFTSDNGPLYDQLGGTDTDFFNSAAGFRGRKGSFYEGGFREPCLVRCEPVGP